MTKTENEKCIELMNDAINHARMSKDSFEESNNKSLTEIDRNVAELQGQNYLGYADGINQVLVTLGFKHDKMKQLTDLL